jgi:2-polyprenyl-3-methyl-5-hydroxy-6-metoxy-1,4-benzoquinol methylase
VVGIEPDEGMATFARQLQAESGRMNLEFRHIGLYDLTEVGKYDLVVLDNVFEHLPDQPRALELISALLKPAGVAFLLMPNKLWPIEAHYHLPFLSYLPLRLANTYLRITGRGTDYRWASYAPTWFRLKRLLRARPELAHHFVLPADPTATMVGDALHYRLGMAAIRRFPLLWVISKAFLVILVKGKA